MGWGGYSYGRAKKTASKTNCGCGGMYTNAIYSGAFANCDPQENHEKSKMVSTTLPPISRSFIQSFTESGDLILTLMPLFLKNSASSTSKHV